MSARANAAVSPPANGPANGAAPGLWWGIFAAPIAWSVDEVASLYFHEGACMVWGSPRMFGLPAFTVALALIGLLMGGIAASGAVTAFRARWALGADTGQGPTRLDQRQFMAHAGIILSVLFLFGIVLRLLTTFFIPPCTSL